MPRETKDIKLRVTAEELILLDELKQITGEKTYSKAIWLAVKAYAHLSKELRKQKTKAMALSKEKEEEISRLNESYGHLKDCVEEYLRSLDQLKDVVQEEK